MNIQRPLLCSALLAPLVAFAMPADKVSFHPEEGLSLTKSIQSNTQMALDDMTMTMNGQPMPMDLEMEMDMSMNMSVEVTDEYVSTSDGRPAKLKRTFDALGSTGSFAIEMAMMPGGGDERSIDATSELEGKTVVFTWNEEEGEYETSFAEDEGDEELLEGLEQDLDFLELLPSEEVAEGDTWNVDVKELTTILVPGGDLKLEPEDMDDEMSSFPGMDQFGANSADWFGDMLEGEATCEYKGTREVDGVTVGVIALVVNISSTNDMSEMVGDAMGAMPEDGPEVDVEYMDIELEMEAEGLLYWNLAGGHAQSFELNGSVLVIMDMGMNMTMGDNEMSMEQTMEMSGSWELNATFGG